MKNNKNLPFVLLMAWLISPLLVISARTVGYPDKESKSVAVSAKELSGFYPSGDFSPGLSGSSHRNNFAPDPFQEDMDFGDAPEGTNGYPTTLINNGARHIIVPGIYLGNGVDPEPDGQPGINADCDDSDCLYPSFGDDEDGVAIPSSVSPGSTVTIVVSASVNGYLDAWMDFNHINGWADSGEHIFTNIPLVAGSNTLSFTVPGNAAIGQSYVRFRFRDYSNSINFDGLVQNGEVEDYLVNIVATPNGNIDFGDAPEGTNGYPTTLANNGARHTIVPGIFLGNSVDPEPDGQPSINADCDDNDCLQPSSGDDEDGVIMPYYISPGSTVSIGVIASVNGYLDAWMDFNHINGWSDAGEHIFTNTPLVAGSNTISFTVPGNAVPGQTYARFRFRDNANPVSFTGLVSNGEVEDYTVVIEGPPVEDMDFGDAPEGTAGYPTTLSNNGARHIIVPGIYLGNSVDPEPDGQPSINADCDDSDCLYPSFGDDEDGVTIPSSVTRGSTVSIVISASVNGYLDAWMDFNQINGWADSGEHIFTNIPLAAGSNTLSFTVPGNAVVGQSYVRFRFRDYPGTISFTGLVQNGEVEDYAVSIVATSNGNIDFGDAPEGTNGYPTTLANNGARHTIVPGIFLGNSVDPEPDGQPSINADCDDNDCLQPSSGDDEDGVIMPYYISPGSTVSIGVVASVNGYLDAWMDFNHINGWADAGEHIFTNTPLVAGSTTISFTVPANAVIGQTCVRFRFRDNANPISFTGLVSNGEVEDYAIVIEVTPVVFNVTGGGTYCAGTGGLPVGLDGSEAGVTYTLYKNGDPQIPPVAGTGAAISFGNQFAGTYTVSGTNLGGTTPMAGNAVIAETPVPVATITPSGSITICAGGSVILTSSSGDSYLWSTLETTSAITVSLAGSYTVRVTTNGCSDVSDTVTLTVYAQLTANFIADKLTPEKYETVQFTDLTTGGATAWNWSFDRPGVVFVNGTSALSQNPQVQFTDGGLYQVTLLAMHLPCSDTEIKSGYLRAGIPGKWTGNTSSDWNTLSNWDNYLVPDGNIDVVIPPTASFWPVFTGDLILGIHCRNLILSAPTSRITIIGDFVIQ